MKIIEKIQRAEQEGRVIFSMEYHPPRTQEDDLNVLFNKMDRMLKYDPCFFDVTWGASGSSAHLTLDIANTMQNTIGVETMMHLTCTNMTVEKLNHALDTIKSRGIENVFALRGDPPKGQDQFVPIHGGFASALDLVNFYPSLISRMRSCLEVLLDILPIKQVRHIRGRYGDYFSICVAGYPEGHQDLIPSSGTATLEAYKNDITYLKRKVDAGADFIITQLFYDTSVFFKFVSDCRQIGITCPIIPGVLPLNDYGQFWRINKYCKSRVPPKIADTLELIKHDEEAVRKYGINLGTEMCREILAEGIKTLHLFTLNKDESALAILQNLGLVDPVKILMPLSSKHPVYGPKEDVQQPHVTSQ